jgi:hypothetical protein
MNKVILLVFVFSGLLFAACDFESGSNFTPAIYLTEPPLKNGKDSIRVLYTKDAGVYKTDTIFVGDTIFFKIYADGYANNLTALLLKQSENEITKLEYPDTSEFDKFFLAGSDYAKGEFLTKGDYLSLYFPFYYIALKPGLDARLKISVMSDAKFDSFIGSNTKTIEIITPIRAKN